MKKIAEEYKHKAFKIWDKHKNGNKFLEENELTIGDFNFEKDK